MNDYTKRILTGASLILCFIMFQSCTPPGPTIEEAMQSWMGHHKSEIIAKWGAYSRTIGDGKGGEILIYETTSKSPGYVIPNEILGFKYYQTIGGSTDVHYREVFVDKSGKIYYIRWGTR